MKNPLLGKDTSTKITVSLDPIELLKNPNLLNKYYGFIEPLLIDALIESKQITDQLENQYKLLIKNKKIDLDVISLIRSCDYRLYKVFFELAHALKEAHTKKYQTIKTDYIFTGCLTRIAQWYDQFMPLVEHLFMKLPDFEDALISIWEVYDQHGSLYCNKPFAQGRLAISSQFTELFKSAIQQLLNIIQLKHIQNNVCLKTHYPLNQHGQ